MTPGEIITAYRLGKTGAHAAKKVYRLLPLLVILAVGIFAACYFWKGTSLTDKASELIQSTIGNIGNKENASSNAEKKKAKITRVVDGDTVRVKLNGKEIVVRLIGIDCPESVSSTKSNNTAAGKKASKFTKKHLKKGRTVWLEYGNKIKEDQYGRTLAFLYIKNTEGKKVMYNRILLKTGMARAAYYANTGNPYRKNFRTLAQRAKKQKKGFWENGFRKAFPNKTESAD